MTLQMRAVLAAASGPGRQAFLIVQNHSDAIYKHAFLGEDELELVFSCLR